MREFYESDAFKEYQNKLIKFINTHLKGYTTKKDFEAQAGRYAGALDLASKIIALPEGFVKSFEVRKNVQEGFVKLEQGVLKERVALLQEKIDETE